MVFFWSRPTAAATDRFDHRSTWRGGGRKGFLLHLSMCFFYSAEYSVFFCFFSARRSFPVDHSILPMFFFEKTRGVFTSLSFSLVPLFLFFFFTPACANLFFWFSLLLFLRWEGKGKKKLPQLDLVQPKPRSLSPTTTETDIIQNFMRLQPNRTYLKQLSTWNAKIVADVVDLAMGSTGVPIHTENT